MGKAVINGIECLFCYDERFSHDEAPTSYPYMYQIRHDEDDWNQPISIEQVVWVNFFGTVFFREPIDFGKEIYLEVGTFESSKELVPFSIDSRVFKKLFHLKDQKKS
jgi:hypothetical protein